MTNSSHKLTAKQKADLLKDMETEMRDGVLAKKYGVDHKTVYYYRRTRPAVLKQEHKPRQTSPPSEYDEPPEGNGKTYEELIQEDEQAKLKRQQACAHGYWIKRCSCCGAILESDTGPNQALIYKHKKIKR